MIKPPAISTVHAVLDRHGLVKRRKRRRYRAEGTALHPAHEPNGLWCADYKGDFMLGNQQYCYPLTITDYRSRYLLACEGVASTCSDFALAIFERAFKDFGLPRAIRTDNGTPFASGNALFGLSRLSVWWLRCPTGHIGNTPSEHMGNTFWHLRETRDALEGVIQDGRAHALCGALAGGRKDGGAVPGVRYLAQDRLQALQPVQGRRA